MYMIIIFRIIGLHFRSDLKYIEIRRGYKIDIAYRTHMRPSTMIAKCNCNVIEGSYGPNKVRYTSNHANEMVRASNIEPTEGYCPA